MNNNGVKMKPILFSTPMVQAILDGSKTQTRRVVKPQPVDFVNDPHYDIQIPYKGNMVNGIPLGKQVGGLSPAIKCPYGQPGDILWVRETWQQRSEKAQLMGFDKYIHKAGWKYCTDGGWKPSIHMPKEACRLFLRMKSARVERLQDMSEKDARAEGVKKTYSEASQMIFYKDYLNPDCEWRSPIYSFQSLWESINGAESWDANPWVWVVEFERVNKEDVRW